MITLGTADPSVATRAPYTMFRVHGTDPDGMAGRLRTFFTGEAEPTTESLIAGLPDLDSFLGVLTLTTLAERGAAAFTAVHDALRAFPFPAQQDSGTWWADETTKCRLLHALAGMGATAAPATLTVIRLRADEMVYRDTRHAADVALEAIGFAEAVDALALEILRRVERDGHTGPGGIGCLDLLDALQMFPPAGWRKRAGSAMRWPP